LCRLEKKINDNLSSDDSSIIKIEHLHFTTIHIPVTELRRVPTL